MDTDAQIEAIRKQQKAHRWGHDCFKKYGAHSPWARAEAARYCELGRAIQALEAMQATGEPVYVDELF